MSLRLLFLRIGWVSLSLCSQGVAAPLEVSFEGLGQMVQNRSAIVQSAKLEKEAAQEREGSLTRSFMPKIELRGAQENFKAGENSAKSQPSYSAEASINLFRGGRDLLESEIRTLSAERRSFTFRQEMSEELSRARTLFWEIVASHELISLTESAIQLNKQNLASAEKRIRSGVATPSDRFEFEMKAVDLQRDVVQAQLKLSALKREFALLIAHSKPEELIFPKKLEHSHDYEELLKHEPKDHEFLYKDQELKARELELSAKAQRRVLLPELEAFAGYSQSNESGEFGASEVSLDQRKQSILGLRVKLDWGGGVEATREASALMMEARADSARAELKKREVETHIENELAELKFLHDQVHASEANIERAEKYYRLTQSEYARGAKNSPDVLGASERFFETQVKRLEIIKEFQLAKTHVISKLGR